MVGDHALVGDATHSCNLLPCLWLNLFLRAADEHVGNQPHREQLLGALLGGLRLLHAAEGGQQAAGHEAELVGAQLQLERPERLQERRCPQVTNGAADLHEADVRGLAGSVGGGLSYTQNLVHDLVRDMRDQLNRLAQVFSLALVVDHGAVDLAGSDVVLALQMQVQRPLVVTHIQIRLRTIIQDEHLTVLVGAHQPRVRVQVGVHLDDRYAVPLGLEHRSNPGTDPALAHGPHHSADHADELGAKGGVELVRFASTDSTHPQHAPLLDACGSLVGPPGTWHTARINVAQHRKSGHSQAGQAQGGEGCHGGLVLSRQGGGPACATACTAT
mmetsp:Transcript_49212/g.87887  ORF Transcript_49212/g.87887 Transcript_49212/m.87887 type:complete len:330 (-) Transcript_49212:387-1376(-)